MITAEQRLERRAVIGSSDSPAICGVDPYRSAADVWASKVYDVAESDSNESIEIGNDFEAPLIAWAARQLGVDVLPDVSLRLSEPFGANLDALIVGKREAIEAKTGSSTDYGDPGTDQVPERVIVQTQHQMLVGELDLVWIPVLLARRDHLVRQLYRVERNEELIAVIRKRGLDFWQHHVEPKIRPQGDAPALDVLRRIRRQPQTVALVEQQIVTDYETAQAALKTAKHEAEEAQARLLAAIGDAEAGDYGDPTYHYTYLESSRKAYAVEATTYRSLRRAKK